MSQAKQSNSIKVEPNSITILPYSERQLIVVVADEILDAERELERKPKTGDELIKWENIASKSLELISGPLASTVIGYAFESVMAVAKARESGISVLSVKRSAAEKLKLPPGHPRDGVLYICHPVIPSIYYTAAQFHRLTFEHKFVEAINLLMSLGAKKLSVEYQSGWGKDFAAHLSVPLTPHSPGVAASVNAKSKSGVHLLFGASLSPKGKPKLPKEIAWYHHEPTWQQIAKGRLEHGLNDFCLILRYEDDFGVNAGLKVRASKSGLDLGGNFENHQSTIWRIDGTFGK